MTSIARTFRALATAAVVATAAASAAEAQNAGQSGTLERVESLIASGRLTDARTTLERWIAEHPPGSRDATAAQRSHALLLQGRLTSDVREAEEAYLAVVLSYPTTPHADEALLRLGQVLVAIAMADGTQDQARRGASYLERLINDYPSSPHRQIGMLWLARAHEVAGDYAAACRIASEAAAAGTQDPTLDDLFRQERATACADTRSDRSRAQPSPRPERRTEQTAAPSGARFAVQAAALRSAESAESLAERLRRAGFDPRVVQVDGSSLHRVRIGRFHRTPEAAAVARRLRQAGFDAVVVTDAHREIR